MKRQYGHAQQQLQLGLSVVELLVAMMIGSIVLAGLIKMASSSRQIFLLHENVSELQESGRFAMDRLSEILSGISHSPEPWSADPEEIGLTDATADGVRTHSDRLVFRGWSDRNCFGNLNPVVDETGLARYFLRESTLQQNSSKNLSHTCRYGPNPAEFVTQIKNQGLIQNVEAVQALYAEDLDADSLADRWVTAGNWQNQDAVTGLQLALLISSSESVVDPVRKTYSVLDHQVYASGDGKLRAVFSLTKPLPNP